MHLNCYMRFPINEVHQCNKSINVKTDVNWTLHALQEWPKKNFYIFKETVGPFLFFFPPPPPPPPPLYPSTSHTNERDMPKTFYTLNRPIKIVW